MVLSLALRCKVKISTIFEILKFSQWCRISASVLTPSLAVGVLPALSAMKGGGMVLTTLCYYIYIYNYSVENSIQVYILSWYETPYRADPRKTSKTTKPDNRALHSSKTTEDSTLVSGNNLAKELSRFELRKTNSHLINGWPLLILKKSLTISKSLEIGKT